MSQAQSGHSHYGVEEQTKICCGVLEDVNSNVLMVCNLRLLSFDLRELLPYSIPELLQ
jgi:hypothetical protein